MDIRRRLYTPFAFLLGTTTATNYVCTDGSTSEGTISFPNQCYQTFQAGTGINITWATTYAQANVYYCQYGNEANSIPLVSNVAPTGPAVADNMHASSFGWTLPTSNTGLPSDLTIPFHIHIVNAEGTPDQLLNGGFWSTIFYIRSDVPSIGGSASSSIASPIPTSTAPLASSLTSVAIASAAAVTSSAVTSDSSASVTSISPSATAKTSLPQSQSVTRVGLGIGLGIGMPLLLCLAGICFFLATRNRRKKLESDASSAVSEDRYYSGDSRYNPNFKRPVQNYHELQSQPSELFDNKTQPRFELDGHS